MQMQVTIFVRVSTTRQETARQVSELKAWAKQRGHGQVRVVKEQLSGATKWQDRPIIKNIMAEAELGQLKHLYLHEISRISRRPADYHHIYNHLLEYHVNVHVKSFGISSLQTNGKRNPVFSMMAALFAEMAREERELLSERIRSGMAEAKSQGKHIGRPHGKMTTEEFLDRYPRVQELYHKGLRQVEIQKLTGLSRATVYRVCRHLKTTSTG